MLEQLTIQNFQAHKRLEVPFDPHVTTIVGPSDVGKSAVVRALTWLATNKPAGDSFIREGSKQATVLLDVDDHQIQRTRSTSQNTYELDGRELKAFGNDVPPEILAVLNLSEVNFQGQHDSPFWFCETAGEVSRRLNQIVDLSIIDTTLASLDKALRAGRDQAKLVEERLQQAKARRGALKSARDIDQALVRLEQQGAGCVTMEQQTGRLHTLFDTATDNAKRARRSIRTKQALDEVVLSGTTWQGKLQTREQVVELVKQLVTLTKIVTRPIPNVEPVLKLRDRAKDARRKAEDLSALINRAKGFAETLAKKIPNLSPLDKLLQIHKTLQERLWRLKSLLDNFQSQEAIVREKAELAKKARSNFEREMGEVCPLCGK